jgi:hypothetical protein
MLSTVAWQRKGPMIVRPLAAQKVSVFADKKNGPVCGTAKGDWVTPQEGIHHL